MNPSAFSIGETPDQIDSGPLALQLVTLTMQDSEVAVDGALGRPAFYLFFVPSNLSVVSGLLSMGLVLRRRPDPGERTRLIIAIPARPSARHR